MKTIHLTTQHSAHKVILLTNKLADCYTIMWVNIMHTFSSFTKAASFNCKNEWCRIERDIRTSLL